MGQELVYCFKCGNRLKASDFDKAAAFRISDKTCCSTCAVGLLMTLSQEDQQAVLQKIAKAKEPEPPTAPPHKVSTVRKAAQRGDIATSQSSAMPIVMGLALVAVIGVTLVIALSGKRTPPSPKIARPPAVEPPAAAAPAKPPDEPKPPNLDPKEASAKKALDAARAIDAKDLPAKVKAYQAAVWESEKTSVFDEATREHAAWLDKWRKQIESELAAVDDRVRGWVDTEEFRTAIEALKELRTRYSDVEWTVPIDRRQSSLKKTIDDLFQTLANEAIAAKKKGEDGKKWSDRIARWGLDEYRSSLESSLAEAAVDEPPKPPAPPSAAYQEAWGQAMNAAALRQFPSAAKILQQFSTDEAKSDLELLRPVRQMFDETQEMLSQWPQGRALPASYYDDAGAVKSTKDEVNFVDRHVVEYRKSGFVAIGDLTAESILKLRKERNLATDDRTAALFLLLDGSKADVSLLPEKYRNFAAPKRGPTDKQARDLFGRASKEYRTMATRIESVDKYRTLLNDFAESELVKRNEELIRTRSAGDKEYVLDASDMKATGTIRSGKDSDGEVVWLNESDSDSKSRENYVEFEFYATAGTTYRTLIRFGACCQETAHFLLQANDLKGLNPRREQIPVEPGSNTVIPFNPRNERLLATHSGHKAEPTFYGWIQLSVIKYDTPGIKKVRVFSNKRGYALKYAVVTADAYRDKVPRVPEVRAALKMQ